MELDVALGFARERAELQRTIDAHEPFSNTNTEGLSQNERFNLLGERIERLRTSVNGREVFAHISFPEQSEQPIGLELIARYDEDVKRKGTGANNRLSSVYARWYVPKISGWVGGDILTMESVARIDLEDDEASERSLGLIEESVTVAEARIVAA